jgi:glycosyltransferase involved in cell wall biosynthesis
LDLARELRREGYSVRFYSYVPERRARDFGLADECHVALLPFVLPLVAWDRCFPRFIPRLRERLLFKMLNWTVIMRLRACDVFICMSGIYLEAARSAKCRFGAMVWLERGSKHILSQDEILAALPGADRPSPLAVARELAGYKLADRIVVPSKHVHESFIRDPAAYAKVFVNCYGVDLDMFPLRPLAKGLKIMTILFVGSWSKRKGCDILTKVINNLPETRLVHVGNITDCCFPDHNARFIHVESVAQRDLRIFFRTADLFILASREEGLAMVLLQALASGLPVICTDATGGSDLKELGEIGKHITVVRAGDVDALADAISSWRQRLREDNYSPIRDADRRLLSWASYGRRYGAELLRAATRGYPR